MYQYMIESKKWLNAELRKKTPLWAVILKPSSVNPYMDNEKRVTRVLLTYLLEHEESSSSNHYATQKLGEKQYKVDFHYQLTLKNGDTLPSKYSKGKDISEEHFVIKLDNISGGM